MKSVAGKHHVMHLVESLEVGGMENGVVNLANLIDKERFKLSVCCLSHPGSLSQKLDPAEVAVFSLNWKGGVSPALFFQLARHFRDAEVQVVHTHGWLTLLYGSVAALLARVPVLINGEHGTFHLDNFRRRATYRALSFLVHRYVAVSFSLEQKLRRIIAHGRERILCIPNGVDVQRFSPRSEAEVAALRSSLGLPAGALVIGSVGRLEPVKNYQMLLRVFARLSLEEATLQCVLVGDGSLREALAGLARELGVADRVHFTGKVDQPHQAMHLLDLFVSSSLSEGMSNTILEAMACGMPVVATEVGDSGHLVREGETGFLVPSEDAPGLEHAIKKVLSNAVLRREMGTRARASAVESYGISRMIDRYQELYFKSISEKVGLP
jgi:sugar transferase (PEP-CTERM/EpsH1 system associated)